MKQFDDMLSEIYNVGQVSVEPMDTNEDLGSTIDQILTLVYDGEKQEAYDLYKSSPPELTLPVLLLDILDNNPDIHENFIADMVDIFLGVKG